MPESNPFFHRGPVVDPAFFFGRNREEAFLFDLLQKGQSVAVSGPRRIGKTSLLHHIKNAHASAGIFSGGGARLVFLDGGTLDNLDEEAFFGAIDRGLGGETDAVPYARLLDRLRREFGQPGAGCLVALLDEFELIAANPRFGIAMFNRLRGLAAEFPVQFVTASKQPLWQITRNNPETLSSPFFNIFAPLPLGPLEDSEALAMLGELSARGGKRFSDATCRLALTLAGTHPLFLQVVGYRLFEAAGPDGDIAPDDRPSAEKTMRADLEPHLQYYWKELNPEDRYRLAVLPLLGGAPDTPAGTGLVAGGRYAGTIVEGFIRAQTVPGLLQGGPFLLDTTRGEASVGSRRIHLTPTEFSLLRIFLERPGRVLAPTELESALWPDDHSPDPDRARGVIKKLRAALGDFGDRLVNQRGHGYFLVLD